MNSRRHNLQRIEHSYLSLIVAIHVHLYAGLTSLNVHSFSMQPHIHIFKAAFASFIPSMQCTLIQCVIESQGIIYVYSYRLISHTLHIISFCTSAELCNLPL